jgi:hypothetical protein
MPGMRDREEERRLLESAIEKRLAEHFAALRGELERLRAESDGRWAGFAARLEQGIDGIVPVGLRPQGMPAAHAAPPEEVSSIWRSSESVHSTVFWSLCGTHAPPRPAQRYVERLEGGRVRAARRRPDG